MDKEALIQEVSLAMYRGDKAQARNLLTQLITQDPTKAQYWVWLSNVSASKVEQVDALQQALRLDPNRTDVRNQLKQMGCEPVNLPPPLIQQKSENRPAVGESPSTPGRRGRAVMFRLSRDLTVLGLWAIVASLVAIAFWIGMSRKHEAGSFALPGTAKPSATLLPTTSPVVRSPTPTFTGPTPLWMFLEATYTPTPVYVNTPHPMSEAYRVGLQKYQQGDLVGMIGYMEQVLTLEPGAADASFMIGEGYRLQGEPEKALEYYEKAIVIDPAFAPAYLGRAQANFAADVQADVASDVDQALNLDPNLVEAYLFSAEVDIEKGDSAAALEHLSQAENLAGASARFYGLRAQAYLLARQNAEALEDALQAHNLDLTMLSGYRILGLAYQANEAMEASIDPLEVYLRYETEDVAAWISLAKGQHAVGDDEAALQSLGQALAVDAAFGEAYLMRGTIYLDQSEIDGQQEAVLQALDEFTQATIYQADPFRLAIEKGRAYFLLGMNDSALDYFNRALENAADDASLAEGYYWRARTYSALDQPAAAQQDWQALLALPEEACQAEWRTEAEQQVGTP